MPLHRNCFDIRVTLPQCAVQNILVALTELGERVADDGGAVSGAMASIMDTKTEVVRALEREGYAIDLAEGS